MKDKNTKLVQEAIIFAINSISEDIQKDCDINDNSRRAATIKILAEAYREVSKNE